MSEYHVDDHLSFINASCLVTSSKDANAVSVSTSKAHLLWCQWKDCSFLLQYTLCVLSTSQRDCVLQGSLQVTMYLCVFKFVECMRYQCKLCLFVDSCWLLHPCNHNLFHPLWTSFGHSASSWKIGDHCGLGV